MELWLRACERDRLSNLQDELLIRILSLIPTKYAVVVCVLLRKRALLPWITSLDFDASSIRHCLKLPIQIERFPSFQTFVDSFLQAHQSPSLTCFRLHIGVCKCNNAWTESCHPDLKSTQINAWITFPLTRCGLRELDLCIHVKGPPRQVQLPPQVFTKETLVVLKLVVNLSFDGISSFRLPNLKVLHLNAFFKSDSEEAFLTSLVSNCPLLEELNVEAYWYNSVRSTKIASSSLRRLSLFNFNRDEEKNSDIVVLDTPNLEYLRYIDNQAFQYSVTKMDRLVEATIDISIGLSRAYIQEMLILIRALSNVRHLSLDGTCPGILADIVTEKQLPIFHNLILLKMKIISEVERKFLVTFLNRSPNLKTLVFPMGLGWGGSERLELEQESRTLILSTIPWCCRFNLKRIFVYDYHGYEEEVLYIQFLLKYSLVLEELVVVEGIISHVQVPTVVTVDPPLHESTLMNLPRASSTCSIELRRRNTHFPPHLY